MAEEKWVTWEGLQYYDSKVKDYIETQISEVEEAVPSKEEFNDLKHVVSDIAKSQVNISSKVDSYQDHIDENEAAIESLRQSELTTAADIAELKTHIEYTVKKDELKDYATKSFVKDAILAAELSKDVDLSDYYNKHEVDNLINEIEIDVAKNTTRIEGLSERLSDVSDYVDRNHDLIEDLLVSVENKANETHTHHISDIVDYQQPDLTNYVTKAELKETIDNLEYPSIDTTNYYTKSETDTAINEAIDNLFIPDMDNYYTKTEVDSILSDIENFATREELKVLTDAVSNVEEALDEKANKEDIPDVSNLVTKEEVQTLLDNIDLSIYVTNEVLAQNYITSNEIAQTYITEQEANTIITEQVETKVVEVVQEKVDSGEIEINASAITYGTF